MATVKVKWRPSVVGGKAGTIYFQIIHNRVVRQLATDYKIYAEEWDDTLGTVKSGSAESRRAAELAVIGEHLSRDLRRLNAIVERFSGSRAPYGADDVTAAFSRQMREGSFFNLMRSEISRLRELNRQRTAENYEAALRSFMRFCGGEDLLPGELDAHVVMRYESSLMARGVSRNTSSFYMRILRAVYNRSAEREQSERRDPFRHVYTGVDKTSKRAVPFAAVKRIRELDLSQHPTLDFARDMFLFSFYMRGMSFVDMAYLRKSDLRHGIVTYRRRKTGRRLSIRWERCMQDIVSKYSAAECRRRVAPESPYMLPIIRNPSAEGCYRNILQQINKALKMVAFMARVDVPLTMYVARHTWASVARSKNIPVAVISEGMGHDSETTTQIYLSSLDTSVIDRANRIILKGL